MARKNKPQIPNPGEVHKQIGNEWTLYKVPGDDRYKLVSVTEIEGHANYSLVITKGRIQATADYLRLRSARPFVYDDVEYAMGHVESLPGDDKFGDIALASGKPMTDQQQWARRVMYVKEKYLTQHGECDIEIALRGFYFPIFGEEPTDKVIEAAKEFITAGVLPNEGALLQVLADYYNGKYRPKNLETLALKYDIICGGFE
jgi:hypothetical protein